MEKQLDLLDECRLQLEYLNGKFGETGTTNSLLSRIGTVLQERGNSKPLIESESINNNVPSGQILVRVFSGTSIEDKCRQQLHPVNEVRRAIELINLKKSIDCYSNCAHFVSTIKYYGLQNGVKTEFYIDGKCFGEDIEPTFEDFNKAFELMAFNS